MARVLPNRPRPKMLRRRQEPTAMDKAIQGINLAGGITYLAGGLGQLFYPGGIPAAISDASRGEASGEELVDAQQELSRNRMRRSVASGGILAGPGGEQIVRPPAQQMPFARDPGAEAMASPRGTGLLNRVSQRGSAMAERQPRQEYANQQMQQLSSLPTGSPSQMAVQAPWTGNIDRMRQGAVGDGTGTTAAPEPRPEAPKITTLDRFRQAAQAAEQAGNLDEFKKWSATALTKGALQIEDLTELQKMDLERTLGKQTGILAQQGRRSPEDAPQRFNDVFSQIVTASTPDEVDDLVRFASSIQPKRGIAESRTYGDKTREMERIEEAAWKRKTQLEGAQFPEVDFKALEDIEYAEGRADLYKEKPARGPSTKPKAKKRPELYRNFNAASDATLRGKNDVAAVRKYRDEETKKRAVADGIEARQPLLGQDPGAIKGMVEKATASIEAAKNFLRARRLSREKGRITLMIPSADGGAATIGVLYDPSPSGAGQTATRMVSDGYRKIKKAEVGLKLLKANLKTLDADKSKHAAAVRNAGTAADRVAGYKGAQVIPEEWQDMNDRLVDSWDDNKRWTDKEASDARRFIKWSREFNKPIPE
tara:strand:+ start:1148 stop:2935 length:1788 start_codon:yes stop_codon:yes gene_type:complete